MWVRFTADFSYRPKPTVVIDYKAGMVLNVPTPAANAAISAGKAERADVGGKDGGEGIPRRPGAGGKKAEGDS